MQPIQPSDRNRLADEAYRRGYYHQSHERCCSQSVVAAVMEACGFKDDGVFRASTALAGGGALFGDGGCGAYAGGLLILGLLKGRRRDNFVLEETDRFKCFEVGRSLHARFVAEYGTAICRDIQMNVYGRPFWAVDPDDYRKIDALGSHSTVGPEIVGKAARWIVETVFDEGLLEELNALRVSSAYESSSVTSPKNL
jgi:hypothetical protein